MNTFPRCIDELDVLCAKSLRAKSLRATSIDGRKCNFLRNECHLRAQICKSLQCHFDMASFAPLMRRQPAASVKRFTDSALPPG
jgi:hypothetical protein